MPQPRQPKPAASKTDVAKAPARPGKAAPADGQDVVEEAIAVLVEMMRSAKSDSARRAAAQALLKRGWGPAGAREPDVVIYEVVTGIERAGIERG
jgi:hypothetical protein